MTERILIVDDDVDTLKLVGLMLERQGYEISVANTGLQGVEKAASEQPDLILLDVMMPDLDGFDVTRRIRANPSLSHIPIIMFTAKSMVEDKVTGFEVGVDDYLTKPTHPAELTAHVKAVISRAAQEEQLPTEQAKVIGFLGTRGGVGTTTVALNIGLALIEQGVETIVAELNPGRGSMALELHLDNTTGLSNLLARAVKDIHLRSVESQLVSHSSGLRLLLDSYRQIDVRPEPVSEKLEAIINNLSCLCTALVLDLGSGPRGDLRPLLKLCDTVGMLVEPIYPSTVIAQTLLDGLMRGETDRSKFKLVLVTRMRTSLQIPWQQVVTDLGLQRIGLIPPSPDQAHQASQVGDPLFISHPKTLITDQLRKLAQDLSKEVGLVPE